MEAIKSNPNGRNANVLFAALFLLIFSPSERISAQLQSSIFTISGWTPGTTPVFDGAHSNVPNMNYGDSLTTIVAFSGEPNDGLETDHDNAAFMSFAYSYTIYLTPYGNSFSPATSIPVSTHTVSAYQSCSSGTVPPWTIGYDNAPTVNTNTLNMNISDALTDCISSGDYQVDILFDNYAQNSVGPNPQPIQLGWYGYAGNYTDTGLAAIYSPSDNNVAQTSLIPANDFLLSQVAFIHIVQQTICPPVAVTLPHLVETFAAESQATVVASYPGECPQSTFTYLWSNGQNTPTATLSKGTYTVTVTSQCGASASAAITIANITDPNMAALTAPIHLEAISHEREGEYPAHTRNDKHNKATEGNEGVQAQLNLYPNPATHNITFDLGNESGTIYTIRILDILGNEIMTFNTAGDQKARLNIDALQAGVYLYEAESEQTFRGKFVKQ